MAKQMTERNLKQELQYFTYTDMEGGNDTENISYPALILILQDLVERMEKLEAKYADEWGLYKFTYDGDHKMYEMLFEGTEQECRQYAYDNYYIHEQTELCLMDWESREWEV
jgi:predicted choloylglycine hydrolase